MKHLTKFPELNSLILPGGVTEAVSLKSLARCRGLKCLSIIDINLQRLKGQLPKAIESLNIRGKRRFGYRAAALLNSLPPGVIEQRRQSVRR
ncbi:hypothetical protein FJT64_008537 [Amphibalanus amphitrite]|uniref:Uncharacterized protein n=1 Tax=Amphibalanus amphitrite TaxID=1232801 RepID=A0A6A4VI94_AMPAM|nr:hypothetical protein FJT64_008537 [Amphibalanus amphitrite]